ncbi:MAG: PQQ-binding-like beta-propeller repeat protein [Tannerella sp.]|jgi:outer membrane protein assembly factor BamB|nr:PQQ-binding-like beta-propeller repeat protein [Tannerella sp.]
MNRNSIIISIIALLALSCMDTSAQDWPQWLGAQRDNISKETGLNLDWSAKKPPLLWTFRQAGAGYSAPTIVGTTLYCQGAADGSDFAFALDLRTGAQLWKQILGTEFIMDRGNGSRGSVTVDGNRLYLVRGGGQLHCLSAADGSLIWQKDFRTDLGGNIMSQMDWGFSESPLIDGNLVICTPGGDQGTVAALDKNTGNVVWRSKDLKVLSGYTSAVITEVGGIRQYVVHATGCVAGVAAKDGRLLWKVDYPTWSEKISSVLNTPVVHDNFVYVSTGQNLGCMGVKLAKDGENIKAEMVYANRNLVNQHGGYLLNDNHIYGFSDVSGWSCQDLQTSELVWSQRKIGEGGKGSILGVNNRLILLDERTGLTSVIAASTDGVKEFGSLEIPERTKIETIDNMVWTHPVVAAGKLFIRNQDLLFCFDLKAN